MNSTVLPGQLGYNPLDQNNSEQCLLMGSGMGIGDKDDLASRLSEQVTKCPFADESKET